MNISFEHFYKCFLCNFLRCIGQVMLQGNAITGLLFLLAIGINSPTLLLGCILATLSALVVAKFGKFNLIAVQSGLYGYNAALVGIAVFYFFPLSLTSLIFVVFGGAFSTLLMHLMMTRFARTPVLTTPFLLTIWLILLCADYAGVNTIVQTSFDMINSITVVDYFLMTMRGIAQVMLQDYWLCGVIFFCALAFNSTKAAVWALVGSVVGTLMAIGFNFSPEMVLMGGYGFNSCLVAIAIAGRYPKKYWLIMLAVLVSVFLTRAFEQLNLPALTAPFVLTVWLMIGFVKVVDNYTEKLAKEQRMS